MDDRLTNRQGMHRSVLSVLNNANHLPTWNGQRPEGFTTRVGELTAVVAEIEEVAQKQQQDITGHAIQKAKEEQELETICADISAALADYYESKGKDALAREVYLAPSQWQGLRDESLLTHAENLHTRLTEAFTADGPVLDSDYALDTADAIALKKETTDFREVLQDPHAAIAQRKAHTQALRPLFQKASNILTSMDRLIPRFSLRANGPALIAAYEAARIIRDSGRGPSSPPPAA